MMLYVTKFIQTLRKPPIRATKIMDTDLVPDRRGGCIVMDSLIHPGAVTNQEPAQAQTERCPLPLAITFHGVAPAADARRDQL